MPLCNAAYWFETNSEGVTRPLPTQHYATQTNGDLLVQPTLFEILIPVSDTGASSQSGQNN